MKTLNLFATLILIIALLISGTMLAIADNPSKAETFSRDSLKVNNTVHIKTKEATPYFLIEAPEPELEIKSLETELVSMQIMEEESENELNVNDLQINALSSLMLEEQEDDPIAVYELDESLRIEEYNTLSIQKLEKEEDIDVSTLNLTDYSAYHIMPEATEEELSVEQFNMTESYKLMPEETEEDIQVNTLDQMFQK